MTTPTNKAEKPLREMTTYELCEWHADRVYRRVEKSDLINGTHWVDRETGNVVFDSEGLVGCPFEPTLDDAARAMPEGWVWLKIYDDRGHIVYKAWNSDHSHEGRKIVRVPDTGDETRDRYLLAALAREAEGGHDGE